MWCFHSPTGIMVTAATRFSMTVMTSSCPRGKKVPVLVRTVLFFVVPDALSTTTDSSILGLA